MHALSAALSLALAGTSIAAEATATHVPTSNRQVQHRGSSTPPDFSRMVGRMAGAFARAQQAAVTARAPARAPAIRAVHSLADQGSGSLREALATAVDGDVIDLSGVQGRIKLSTALQPEAAVTLQGPGEGLLTLEADHRGRVIASGHSLSLSGMSLVNGSGGPVIDGGPALGGCLYVAGDLTLMHATISGCSIGDANTPDAYGGAIAVGGMAYLKYDTISDSTVTAYGSAVGGGLVALGKTIVVSSTVSGNAVNQVLPPVPASQRVVPAGSAPTFMAVAGGVMSLNAYTLLANATVTGNSATAAGGGLYACGAYTCTYFGEALGGAVVSSVPGVVASTISGNSVQANGHAYGGGIYERVTVVSAEHSRAPASPTLGTLTGGYSGPFLKYNTISGNVAKSTDSWAGGGGVMARNTLTIVASAIDNNQVQSDACCYYSGGGGVLSTYGGLTVNSSTISGNSVTSSGGGASSWGGGVGMFYNSTLSVINSTISGNQLAAPHVNNGAGVGAAEVQISNSTIAFNTSPGGGGGIVLYGNASPVFNSTIIAENSAVALPASADVYGIDAADVAGANNLVMANSGANLPDGTLTQSPMLLPLAFNGGPTRTHALPTGSPAVDAGNNLQSLASDQRGYARELGAAADIGAYELDNDRIFTNGFDAQLGAF